MLRPDQHSVPGSWRGSAGPVTAGDPTAADAAPSRLRRRGRIAVPWTPTVTNLLLLVALEIGVYVGLRRVFRTAHGG